MRTLLPFIICLPLVLQGQVTLDVPLRFLQGGEGDVQGLADPATTSSLITVGFATNGGPHWAAAQMMNDTIHLTISPTPEILRNGTLFRFIAPENLAGNLVLSPAAGIAIPLIRADGLPITKGHLRQGIVCEVVLVYERFILTAPAPYGCPPGTARMNERLCIDVGEVTGLSFFEAGDHCARAGGRLCAWDEYYIACHLLGAQLTGLFNDWEWIDDTANHNHTVAQAGLNTCTNQRTTNTLPSNYGSTRCCYLAP